MPRKDRLPGVHTYRKDYQLLKEIQLDSLEKHGRTVSLTDILGVIIKNYKKTDITDVEFFRGERNTRQPIPLRIKDYHALKDLQKFNNKIKKEVVALPDLVGSLIQISKGKTFVMDDRKDHFAHKKEEVIRIPIKSIHERLGIRQKLFDQVTIWAKGNKYPIELVLEVLETNVLPGFADKPHDDRYDSLRAKELVRFISIIYATH